MLIMEDVFNKCKCFLHIYEKFIMLENNQLAEVVFVKKVRLKRIVDKYLLPVVIYMLCKCCQNPLPQPHVPSGELSACHSPGRSNAFTCFPP